MSTTNTDYRVTFTGDGTTGPVSITFDTQLDASGDAKDIKVYRKTSGEAQVDITSLCTVSANQVTLDQAYDSSYTIVVERDPEPIQESQYENAETIPSRRIERDLDRATFILQRLDGERERSLRQPATDTDTIGAIPGESDRAGRTLNFDANGDPEAGSAGSVPVSAAMADFVAAATLADARTELDVYAKGEVYSSSELDAGQLDNRYYTEDEVDSIIQNPYYGVAAQVGSDTAVATVGNPALAALSGTNVAFIDDSNDDLRTYRFNGTGWTQVGNDLNISGISTARIAALSATDVAYIDVTNADLRTYRFDGTDWAQVGNDLNISGISFPGMAALTDTDIALFNTNDTTLSTYRFDGTDWSKVGNSLTISGASFPGMTALNSTDVAFLDDSIDELRTYRFDGTDWSQVGNGLDASPVQWPAVAALNSTDIALIDSTNEELSVYRFDGTDWTQESPVLSIPSIGFIAIAALNGMDVAFIDSTNDDLRVYRFGHCLWQPYRPF